MKKIILSILMVSLLTGCSGNSQTKKVICSGDINDEKMQINFTANGDDLISQEFIFEVDLSDQEFDFTTLSDDVKKKFLSEIEDSSGMNEIEGTSYKVELQGNKVVTTLLIDFEKADLKKLNEEGIIDQEVTNALSLDKTITSFEEEGLTCK